MKKFLSFLMVAMVAFAANARELAVLMDSTANPLVADDWANQPYVLSDAGVELIAAGAEEGMKVRFYLSTDSVDSWKLEIVEGHWTGVTYAAICGVGADTENGKFTEYDLEAHGGYYELVLTQAMLDAAAVQQWWGGTFILNGNDVKCSKLTLNDDITVLEDAFVLLDSTANPLVADDWANQPYVLSDAGVELIAAGAEEGDLVRFHLSSDSLDSWKLEVVEGHWGPVYADICAVGADTENGKFTEYDLEANGGHFDIVLTQEMIDAAAVQQWWGGTFVLNGNDVKCSKVELIKLREVIITETVLLDSTANPLVADGWGNQPYVLSDAGLELAAAEAVVGNEVRFYFVPTNAEWKVEIVEGHWGPTYKSLCSIGADTEDGKFTEYDLEANGGYYALTLTQEMLDAAYTQQWWGGTFLLNGDKMTLTKVVLYQEAPATRDTIFSHQVELDNAYVEYAGGEEVLPKITVYNADSSKVLTIDKDYTVLALDNTDLGVATLTITGKGRYIGTVETTFTIVAKTVTAEMVKVEASLPFYGEAVEPAIEIVCGNDTLVAGTHYTATFANNDAVGTASYTLKFRGKYTGVVEGTFEVVAPLTITADMVVIGTVESYTGSAIEPMVDVVVWGDTLFTTEGDTLLTPSKVLLAGVDYELIYSNNVNASDTAMVTIKGLGYYTGTVDTLYTIEPMEIVDSMVTLDAERYEFAGFSVRPLVTVTVGNTILVEEVDYLVEYANNREVTKNATATVTFQGNYKGTVVKTFEIYAEETALDNIEAEANAVKVLRDGVIYIIRNNQMFDILGHLVK